MDAGADRSSCQRTRRTLSVVLTFARYTGSPRKTDSPGFAAVATVSYLKAWWRRETIRATCGASGCSKGPTLKVAKLVFLLEEPSMAVLLDGLLPRFFPWLRFQCVPHNGKRDLAKSVPRKLRRWREPDVQFVVVQDQDQADCRLVKDRLSKACSDVGRDDVLVRVVCRELEAWYLAEPRALARAFPGRGRALVRELAKARYGNPDAVVAPSSALSKLVPEFQKRSGARRMAETLSRENRSRSFQVFLEGIERLRPIMSTDDQR